MHKQHVGCEKRPPAGTSPDALPCWILTTRCHTCSVPNRSWRVCWLCWCLIVLLFWRLFGGGRLCCLWSKAQDLVLPLIRAAIFVIKLACLQRLLCMGALHAQG